jgi:hypothetical protein
MGRILPKRYAIACRVDNGKEGRNIENKTILREPRHRPGRWLRGEERREAGVCRDASAAANSKFHGRDICAQHASQAQQ